VALVYPNQRCNSVMTSHNRKRKEGGFDDAGSLLG